MRRRWRRCCCRRPSGTARPLVIRTTIDHVIDGQPPIRGGRVVADIVDWLGGRSTLAHNLWIAGALVVGFTAVSRLFEYLRGRWGAIASESVTVRLRDRLFDHLQRLPCAYHDKAEMGDLVQRCTSDVETIRGFLSSQCGRDRAGDHPAGHGHGRDVLHQPEDGAGVAGVRAGDRRIQHRPSSCGFGGGVQADGPRRKAR